MGGVSEPTSLPERLIRSPLSDDGNTVAFSTDASDVVPGDLNGGWDVFVRDLGTGATSWATDSYDAVAFGRWHIWGGRFLSRDGAGLILTGRRSGTAGLWSQPA